MDTGFPIDVWCLCLGLGSAADELENAEYASPQKSLLSMRGEEPLDEELYT